MSDLKLLDVIRLSQRHLDPNGYLDSIKGVKSMRSALKRATAEMEQFAGTPGGAAVSSSRCVCHCASCATTSLPTPCLLVHPLARRSGSLRSCS